MAALLVFGGADADRQRTVVAEGLENLARLHLLQDLFSYVNCAVERSPRQHHTEFVSTAPAHEVRVANGTLDYTTDLRKHPVSDQMAERVVHQFESIDVDHEQR